MTSLDLGAGTRQGYLANLPVDRGVFHGGIRP